MKACIVHLDTVSNKHRSFPRMMLLPHSCSWLMYPTVKGTVINSSGS